MPIDTDLPDQPIRNALADREWESLTWVIENLPLSFQKEHCVPARELLGWSQEALVFRSGVSVRAIQSLERGKDLNAVSMQALAFAFEAEGLVFFPGHAPLKGENCRGSTKDPRSRHDYHLLE
ncbi:helix-turn-helix domain-containing protein [Pseudomonas putida]|uniref:helix-turn-helix domain-containing protein n=1 Tax=Pseudomonas putida TaxID=303 RepID=UPI0018D7F4F5|nr:helix-turn-helix transcriptional regulator [Pseudomonas putida]MBH3412814.1 helix-turn-helix transcriptional regulator [Pseudomonas putida]